MSGLLPGEFAVTDLQTAGLNVPSAVKRGIFTIEVGPAIKLIGQLVPADATQLDASLRSWLDLQ